MARLLFALTVLLLSLTLSRPASATFTPTFTYTGQLLVGGSPVSGTYDFQFGLYTSGGTQVGSTITVTSVSVADGVFYVQIPFPTSAFNGQTLYLQTAYALHPAGTYTTQSPRKIVPTTGYAYYSGLSASTQSLQGNFVSAATPSNGQVLTWQSSGSKWIPQTPASGGSLTLPYYGSVSNSSPAFSVTNSGSGAGVYGTSASSDAGHFVSSGGSNGVYGESDASNGNGVYGVANIGTNAYGVEGYSTNGFGVYGASGNGDSGFLGGIATTSGGTFPTGVTGTDNTSNSDGVGVYGTSVNGVGVVGNSTGGSALFGIEGLSSTSDNFDGQGSGYGVLGGSGSGDGVYGQSMSGYGVEGDGYSGVGVYGGSTNNAGIYGISTNSYGVYGISSNNDAGYFQGDVNVTGTLTAATKHFRIDDPIDPANKYLVHASVESNEMTDIYSGNVLLSSHGAAWVQMPRWFGALNKDFRYQLTAIDAPGPNLYIAHKVKNNKFEIAGGKPGAEVSWQVTGVREDAFAKAHPMQVEELKPASERGLYLDPAAQGKPVSLGIGYAQQQKRQAKN